MKEAFQYPTHLGRWRTIRRRPLFAIFTLIFTGADKPQRPVYSVCVQSSKERI